MINLMVKPLKPSLQTKLYVKPILELKKHIDIKAMSHITGGGFFMKIFRVPS